MRDDKKERIEWFKRRCYTEKGDTPQSVEFIEIQCQCAGISYKEGLKLLGIATSYQPHPSYWISEEQMQFIKDHPKVGAITLHNMMGIDAPSISAISKARKDLGYAGKAQRASVFNEDMDIVVKRMYRSCESSKSTACVVNEMFDTSVTPRQVATRVAKLIEKGELKRNGKYNKHR